MAVGNSKVDVDALLQQLNDADSIVRENSTYVLGEIAAEAKMLSLNTLKSSNELEKMNIMTNETIINRVTDALTNTLADSDPWVRGNAADALGKIGNQVAVGPISELLKDEDKVVRYSAVEALGHINTSEAIDFLVMALDDNEWSVRLSAAKSLEKSPDRRAEKALRKTAKDKNPDVRERSLAALERLSA